MLVDAVFNDSLKLISYGDLRFLFYLTVESSFNKIMILITLVTLSPPLFYPHGWNTLPPFHLVWPRINNQKILDPVWQGDPQELIINLQGSPC